MPDAGHSSREPATLKLLMQVSFSDLLLFEVEDIILLNVLALYRQRIGWRCWIFRGDFCLEEREVLEYKCMN